MLACMAKMCAEEGPGSIVWKSKVLETTQCLPVGARLNQSTASVEPIQCSENMTPMYMVVTFGVHEEWWSGV